MTMTRHAVADWDGNPAPEAPIAPESLKEAGLIAGVPLRHAPADDLHPRVDDRPRPRAAAVPAVQGHPRAAQVPQGREVHPGGRRRPRRRGELQVQPDRPRPQAGAGRDGAVRLRRPGPGAARGLRRAVLPPDRHRAAVLPRGAQAPFSHLVLKEEMFNNIGPAIISGRSVFIYGPPGNGKTAMARAIGDFMNTAGGSIYIPYAFVADGNIITVYDPSLHVIDDTRDGVRGRGRRHRPQAARHRRDGSALGPHSPAGDRDRRRIEPAMLDLRYNAEANFYQAPIHFKANGGVFLIDDFGRQQCSPKELLNRWILPLEDRHDFLTVASGKKFQVPFEQLIIFSTNLDPKDLVDDAFLRRIRHKVGVKPRRGTCTRRSSPPTASGWE